MASILHSVGKYRKLWITVLMVLSMMTFILCAGNKSDITETILKYFVPRHGEVVASVNGTNLYRDDIENLKNQRQAANAYIKSLANQLIEYYMDRSKNLPENLDEDIQKRLNQVRLFQQILINRVHEPSYFGSGTKLEEIIDFKTWLAEADRLGISLTNEELRKLIAYDTYRYTILNAFGNPGDLDRQLERNAELKVRDVSHTASLAVLKRGLMDEYRVRIAKLAAIELQFTTDNRNSPKRLKPAPYLPAELTRLALTPAQIYDFYSENRTEIDIGLLAIPVDKFLGQVGEPDAKALDTLFAKNKGTPYDPTSPEPGFRNQHLIKVRWVSGDPSSPFFKNVTRTANDLAAYPIGLFDPQMPLASALRVAAGPAVFDARIAMEYDIRNRPLLSALSPNIPLGADTVDPNIDMPMANFLAYDDPVAKMAVLGALARPDSIFAAVPLFAAEGFVKHRDLIKEGVRLEVKRRLPMAASVVGDGVTGCWLPLLEVCRESLEPNLVPLPIVREQVAKVIERQQASPWVTANILFLKKQMEESQNAGDKKQMDRLLERYGPDYKKQFDWEKRNYRNLGLEIGETKKPFSRYDVDTDPELKALRDSYEKYFTQINLVEGRDVAQGKPRWTDKDFWKVFFDGSETIGVASESRKFAARPWPPVLTVASPTQLAMTMQTQGGIQGMDMGAAAEFNAVTRNREGNRASVISLFDHAEKPFLVWKTEEQIGDPPRDLAEVKDRVVTAWKMNEAREKKALPYAQKIADGLLKGSAHYPDVLKFAGKDVDAKLVMLSRIAKLAEAPSQPQQGFGRVREYGPYKLQGEVKYPRDDMVPDLIALYGLKEPIKIGVPDIDAVNAALFTEAAKSNRGPEKFVQILTNQPRDTFYVAVVDGTRPVGLVIAPVLRDGAIGGDTLLDRAQAKRGEEFLQTFVVQLRDRFKVKVTEGGKNAENEGG